MNRGLSMFNRIRSFFSGLGDTVRGAVSSVTERFFGASEPVVPVERGYNYDYDERTKEAIAEEREDKREDIQAIAEEREDRKQDIDDFEHDYPDFMVSSDEMIHMDITYTIILKDGEVIEGEISIYQYPDDDMIRGAIIARNPEIDSDDIDTIEYEVM
jgi:hypothetical protein